MYLFKSKGVVMSQFFSINNDNPQKRLILQAVEILNQGGVIVYPTDSGYALGCKIGKNNAIEQMKKIRALTQHNFTLVCSSLSQLSQYAIIDDNIYRYIKNVIPGAYTFILKSTKLVPKVMMFKKKKEVGFRVPNNPIVLHLLEALDEPIISTSLIFSDGHYFSDPYDIRQELERKVDLIIDGGILEEEPSSIIEFLDGDMKILREGAGELSLFR